MNETRMKAAEDEIKMVILERRRELLDSIKVYENNVLRRINPESQWSKIVVNLKALSREIEPFLRAKRKDASEIIDRVEKCRNYTEAKALTTLLNDFLYDLGILKIDFYLKPKERHLED